ncbi:MAG: 50S ribosomal protein L15 [Thermodesulfobacteriota bacterium]
MLTLSNLSPTPGSRKNRKRIGRGQGTGQGGQAGKGHKGAKARSGQTIKIGFEGGQMPLQRRLPKRGFTNGRFRQEVAIVNIRDLDRFNDGETVDRASLLAVGLIKKADCTVKILGEGDIAKKLTVAVDKVSAGARQKIEAAGGSVQE